MKRAVLGFLFVASMAMAQSTTQPKVEVPTIDGGIGPCSAEFNVTGNDGKAIYNAEIHTLIKYGAFGVRKMDLQVSTSYEGRAKFTGLPDVNKRPVTFDVKKDDKTAQRVFDPGLNCHPVYEVILK